MSLYYIDAQKNIVRNRMAHKVNIYTICGHHFSCWNADEWRSGHVDLTVNIYTRKPCCIITSRRTVHHITETYQVDVSAVFDSEQPQNRKFNSDVYILSLLFFFYII